MTETNVNEKSKLVILVGSVREGRFGPTVASWVADRAREHGGSTSRWSTWPSSTSRSPCRRCRPRRPGTTIRAPKRCRPSRRQLDAADAFIVVTPEYNHSYPASLKAMIDWHFNQWTAKPVAFVSYGAAAGGRHAVLHLENVFTELHAVTIRDGLSFPNYYLTWSDGQPQDGQAEVSAKSMLEQLAWWATVLRAARVAVPYPTGA